MHPRASAPRLAPRLTSGLLPMLCLGLLLTVPDLAHAEGTYGPASPAYTGGTFTTDGGTPAQDASLGGAWGFAASFGAVFPNGCSGLQTYSGPLSSSGSITAHLKWNPDTSLASDPPQPLILVETCNNSYSGSVWPGTTFSGSAPSPFGAGAVPPYTRYSAPPGSATLTANCTPSVTVTGTGSLSAKAVYTATAQAVYSAAAYPVTIDLTGKLVNGTYEALTGQTILASLDLHGAPINTNVPIAYRWSCTGGSPFETWNPYTVPQMVPLSATDADATGAYFTYNNATNQDSVTVQCTATIPFLDGTTHTVTAKSQPVTFLKPTSSWAVDPAMITLSGQTTPMTNPHGFIDSSPNGFSVNTTWYPVTISVPAPFSGGQGCFAQITTPSGSITRTPTGTGVATYTLKVQNAQGNWVTPGTGLDGAFPYAYGLTTDSHGQISGIASSSQFSAGSTGASGDNPTCFETATDADHGGTSWTSVGAWNVNFTTWLMYAPSGGIWIPLQKATWSGNGSASGGPSAWHATGGYTAPSPSTVTGNAFDFPQWTQTFPAKSVILHP